MAGRISETDIAAIKDRANIYDLIADHVTLKRAGTGTFKGLCPFHDERTPSFTVNPGMGRYHCFGCQASGDAISFLMEYQHLSFIEAVEQLAARIGYTITYTETSPQSSNTPSKTRLIAACKAAAEFYATQLAAATPEAETARSFLAARGFNENAITNFQIGYSPDEWSKLTDHLRKLRFTDQELTTAGLALEGKRGIYDRFRGRIMWPIRDLSGQTVGFGARRLLEKDTGPKYLNSPESPIYHKSQLLYGIDAAKKAIAKDKRAIIVEGYTDVMACHLAGVPYAVATCGTAFGADHITVLRRILGDDATAEVIFTFDPDSAGQKAAMKAYGEEKRFSAQTYVASNAYGLDPSDLRQQQGDLAVREMFESKIPLFEFALQQAIKGYDLNSVAGRAAALKSAVPIIADIRDVSLVDVYLRYLARMIAVDPADVRQALKGFNRQLKTPNRQQTHAAAVPGATVSGSSEVAPSRAFGISDLPRNPRIRKERDALMAILQRPFMHNTAILRQAVTAAVTQENLRDVQQAIGAVLAAGGFEAHDFVAFSRAIVDQTAPHSRVLAQEMLLAPLPEVKPERIDRYAVQIVVDFVIADLYRIKREMIAQMMRISDQSSLEVKAMHEYMIRLEEARRDLEQFSEQV